MKRRLAWTLCLVALALSWGAVSAVAKTINISGTFEGDSTLTPTGSPGIYTQDFTGDGEDTLFGAFTPSSTSTIDFSNPPNIMISDAMFTETFRYGTLFGTASGSGTANGKGSATFSLDLVITGGTGNFAGDTGKATLTGTLTRTSPTSLTISNASYTGSLSTVDEPSAAILAGVSLVAIGFGFALRRIW